MSKHTAGRPLTKEQLKKPTAQNHNGTREFIESVVIAIILAFLFRAFEAEAFVIPTGSMAPTLMGQHKDVTCDQCQQPYQTTASGDREVAVTVCPTCRFPMELDPAEDPDQRSFSGDRILVSKFAYQIAEPGRWDVIVFKFPGNAKQNYIKRLIGLPGETVRVYQGDIHIKRPGEQQFHIAQRSPEKIKAMLQIVHDNDHHSPILHEIGWPHRWQQPSGSSAWQASEDQRSFAINNEKGSRASLHYRHTVPSAEDWEAILRKEVPPGPIEYEGRLITDFCAYNTYEPREYNSYGAIDDPHWVGDIALEFQVDLDSEGGQLTCEIVEAGVHYQCTFDVAAGKVTLARADGEAVFEIDGELAAAVEAESPLTGPGTHRIRLANVDDSLCLWVDGSPIDFGAAGKVVSYVPPDDHRPHWSPSDPGDLAPARLHAEGLRVEVSSLKILRDIYYIAIDRDHGGSDYTLSNAVIHNDLHNPALWAQSELFASRRMIEFELLADEFFPMGDNSAQSLDGRLWEIPPAPRHAVPRELMIGKALLVYWPHAWNTPVPFTPNPQKMRLIK